MKTFEETTYIEHIEHHLKQFHTTEREYLARLLNAIDRDDEVDIMLEAGLFKQLLSELRFQREEIDGNMMQGTHQTKLLKKFDDIIDKYIGRVTLDIPLGYDLKINPMLP